MPEAVNTVLQCLVSCAEMIGVVLTPDAVPGATDAAPHGCGCAGAGRETIALLFRLFQAYAKRSDPQEISLNDLHIGLDP